MLEKTVSVQLPESIYRRLKRAAELTYRSVDDVLVSAIETNLPLWQEGLPAGLQEELAAMHVFSDAALQAAVEPIFSPSEQIRLSQLNNTAAVRPLTAAAQMEHQQLLAAYHRSVLRRAQALALLNQRGHVLDWESLSVLDTAEG